MARRSGGSRYQFPRMVEYTAGPWFGVKDGPAATQGDAQHAQMILNGYIADPGVGAVLSRPSWLVLNNGVLMGTTATRYPQGIAAWEPPNQPAVVYTFVGGRMYRVVSGSNLSPVDVTPAGVTIDARAPFVYAVNYAGLLVVTDGVNPPWTWDGTTAAYLDWDSSGVHAHTVAYGPPTVYYDQLFFICAAGSIGNRSTLIWSEVNNATLGYIQTVAGFTYADTWTLEQTGSQPLTCILGTNDALFYWRARSTGAIYGQVGTDFVTTGTHDAISASVGTQCPRMVVLTDREVYFIDQTGRPQVLVPGGALTPVWQDCLQTFVSLTAAQPAPGPFDAGLSYNAAFAGSGAFDPVTKCVYWSTAGNTATNVQPTLFAFDTRTKKYLGQWTHTSRVAPAIGVFQLALVPNPIGSPPAVVMHLDAAGNAYGLGLVTGADLTVASSTGALTAFAVELSVEPSEMGYDPWVETTFDRVQFVTLPFTRCDAFVDYTTTRFPGGAYSTAQAVGQSAAAQSIQGEIDVGVNTTGRLIRPRIRQQPVVESAGGTLAIVQIKVRGYQTDMNPGAP